MGGPAPMKVLHVIPSLRVELAADRRSVRDDVGVPLPETPGQR